MSNAHAHRIFAPILDAIEQQPLILKRAAEKASPRRFSNEPITGFGALDDEPDLRTHAQRSADYAEYLRELRDDCAAIDEREDRRLDGGAS